MQNFSVKLLIYVLIKKFQHKKAVLFKVALKMLKKEGGSLYNPAGEMLIGEGSTKDMQ